MKVIALIVLILIVIIPLYASFLSGARNVDEWFDAVTGALLASIGIIVTLGLLIFSLTTLFN